MIVRLPLTDFRGPQELTALDRAYDNRARLERERKARDDARAVDVLWQTRRRAR